MQKFKVLSGKVTVASYKIGSFVAVSRLLTTRYAIMFKESVGCGHHVYKEVWRPVNGQFPILAEPTNHRDKQAVAIY